MSVKTKEDLFMHTLRDVYYAEKRVLKALPKMAKAVENAELKSAFEHHLEETKEQVKRLDTVFQQCGAKAEGETCPAIDGLIEETEELMKEIKDKDVLAAAILAAGQAVEHYEIARYGTLCEWASELGYKDARKLLDETLKEEKKADQTLSKIALAAVNKKAA